MKKIIYLSLICISFISFLSCGIYSLSGGDTGDAKTIQIDFFPNEAPITEPTLSQRFTQDLQDLFTRQTNLTLVKSDGDLAFEGEIVGYRTTPTTATSSNTAAQNRLTITINVRYTNKLVEKDDFEKKFSFYHDYAASEMLTGSVLETALDEILPRITQDIFNASVAKW